jgi:TonB-linked SusC/RagA family outer membrane protein
MKQTLTFLVLVGLLCPWLASAQQKAITGAIASQSGNPVPAASVQVVGTSTGTIADATGHFTIQASPGDTLLVSSLNFLPKKVVVGQGASLEITLEENTRMLQETVVTALGITRQARTLTYSQQTVNGDDLNAVKSTNVVNSLNGRVAGVQINRTSGGPGGSVRMVLRGNKSTRNSQPLFVIDGLPVSNPTGGPDAGLYNTMPDQGDILSTINPDDIASISVLKGASASALYGSQGSNGVILITTKKGKNGVMRVNYTSSITIDKVSILPKLQFKYGQSTPATDESEGSEDSWGAKLSSAGRNYVKDFFNTGYTWINSVDFSSGTEHSSSYFSYSNTDNKGILPNTSLKQNTLSFRQSGSFFNDRLTIDGTFLGSIQKTLNRVTPGIYFNPLSGLYMLPRGFDFNTFKKFEYFSQSRYLNAQNWWDINTDKGFVGQDYQQNPYWIQYRDPVTGQNRNAYVALDLKYKINDWLSIQARGNINYFATQSQRNSAATTQNTIADPNGQITVNKNTSTDLYGDLLLIGNKDLSSNFNLNFTVGTSIQDQKGHGTSVGGALLTPNVFLESAINWTNTSKATYTTSAPRRQIQSLFGNVEIGFKNKIFLSLSDRNDWSSTLAFTPSMKKGYNYPSVGANAILSDIFKLPSAISFAKIRASYAIVGNDIGEFATYPLYSLNGGNPNAFATPPGSLPINKPGYYLQPEKNKSLEVGTQWRFFEDRLSLDFTWYRSNITNQFYRSIGTSSGLGQGGLADINGGNIRNSGVEVSVSYRVLNSGAFTWATTVNASYNKNKITELYNYAILANPDPNQKYSLNGGGGLSYLKLGGSFGDFYGRAFKRDDEGHIVVNAATGVPLFQDDVLLGNPNPDWIAGWSNDLSFKGINLSFLIDGKFGGKVISITDGYLDQMGVSERSAAARDNGGVSIPNAVDESGKPYTEKTDAMAYYKGIGGKTPVIEAYMFSATAVRLRSVSLSYNLPIRSNVVKNLSVGLIGSNLFFFYRKAPFDPEQVSGVTPGGVGQDVFGLPAYRSFGFTLKASF